MGYEADFLAALVPFVFYSPRFTFKMPQMSLYHQKHLYESSQYPKH
jgi:hypothetical protein